MNNKGYFEENAYQAIRKLIENESLSKEAIQTQISVIVQVDEAEKQPGTSNWDDIMRLRMLPALVNKEILLPEAVDWLSTPSGEFPLYVKIHSEGPYLFRWIISKRFRKRKVIENWHQGNEYAPFMLDWKQE
jgi:hypothetical protein